VIGWYLDLQLCNIENCRVFAETVKALTPYKRHTISEIEYEIGRENEFNYNTFVVDHLIPKLETFCVCPSVHNNSLYQYMHFLNIFLKTLHACLLPHGESH